MKKIESKWKEKTTCIEIDYLKGRNFRGKKFSRELIFAGIYFREFWHFREIRENLFPRNISKITNSRNSRKFVLAKYRKHHKFAKFAKISSREIIFLKLAKIDNKLIGPALPVGGSYVTSSVSLSATRDLILPTIRFSWFFASS